jgi:hypothetical protein
MYVLSIRRGTSIIILITSIKICLDSRHGRDFLHNAQTGCGAQPASYPVGIGAISPGVKRPRREVEHSLPFSTEVKNGGAIPPLPHVFKA